MFDVQTYTKLHDAPCNFCGFFLQNLILAVLKRPKIGIWKEIARYTVQVLRKTARCIVQFCFLTRKAALPLPQLPPSPVREAAGGSGGCSGSRSAALSGKVYDYHTGACMIFIQSARQSPGKLGRTLIILYFRLTIKHTNPPIT